MKHTLAPILSMTLLAGLAISQTPSNPTWVRETPAAQWQPRDSQGELVFRNKLWIFGGWFNSYEAPPRDVWSSENGKDWKLVEKKAPWIHSDLPMTISFQDKMWLMGGWYNGRLPDHGASNQVWASQDGTQWEQIAKAATWSPRLAAGLVEFQGRMWILGGTENYYFGNDKSLKNDVWSSKDGKNWKLETDNAPWSPRLWFSSAVYRDRIWVLGGWSNNPSRNWGDIWSSADGKNWEQFQSKATWKERHEHSAFVFQDKLWIAGGHAQPLSSEVWSLNLPKDFFNNKR